MQMRAIHMNARRMVVNIAAGTLSNRFELPPMSRFRFKVPCDTLTQVQVDLWNGETLLDSQSRSFLTSLELPPVNLPTDRLIVQRMEAQK